MYNLNLNNNNNNNNNNVGTVLKLYSTPNYDFLFFFKSTD